MLAKLFKNRFFWPILLIILIIPAFNFLLKPGIYWKMHDDMQMIRQLEFEKCLKDGQIPCRWTPDLGFGYGYPLFNFYPPFPSFVGQIFRTLSFSFIQSVKFSSVAQFILAALFMYILASSLFGKLGGFIAALFYTYAPYHALNIYVRGAINEAWAAVFFPLIFYFSKKIIEKNKITDIFGLGISFAFLLLCHNPMVLTFTPILFVWVVFWLWQTYGFKIKSMLPIIKNLILSGILSLFLAAFFTIPLITETKYAQIDSMFKGYFYYSAHFVSVKQMFFSNFWDDGGSAWGVLEDGMSFMIGFSHWILTSLILIYFIFTSIKAKKFEKKLLLPIILIIMGFGCAFMAHGKSTFLWLILSPIQKIQFPWRFLNHTTFLFSLAIGILPFILKKYFSKKNTFFISIFVVVVLFITNISHFYPVHSGPLTDVEKFSGNAWTNQITSGIYDYLPKTASTAAKSKAADIIDMVEPDTTEYQLLGWQKGTNWWLFNLQNETSAKFTLASLYFPNFKLYDNQQELSYEVEPELGRITINLDPGYHQIYLKFYNTPVRTFSNYLSLFAWIFVIVFFISKLWKTKKFKK